MECIVRPWTTSTIIGKIFLLLPNWRRTCSFYSTGHFFCNRQDPYFVIGKILTFCFVLSPSLVHLNIISCSKKTTSANFSDFTMINRDSIPVAWWNLTSVLAKNSLVQKGIRSNMENYWRNYQLTTHMGCYPNFTIITRKILSKPINLPGIL